MENLMVLLVALLGAMPAHAGPANDELIGGPNDTLGRHFTANRRALENWFSVNENDERTISAEDRNAFIRPLSEFLQANEINLGPTTIQRNPSGDSALLGNTFILRSQSHIVLVGMDGSLRAFPANPGSLFITVPGQDQQPERLFVATPALDLFNNPTYRLFAENQEIRDVSPFPGLGGATPTYSFSSGGQRLSLAIPRPGGISLEDVRVRISGSTTPIEGTSSRFIVYPRPRQPAPMMPTMSSLIPTLQPINN